MEIISCPVDRPQDSGRGEFTLSCCWDHSDFYTHRDDRNKSAIAPITRNNSHRISDNMIGQLSKIEETAMLATIDLQDNFTIEDFMANPCDRMEWVDGQLVQKNSMTLKHSRIQSNLSYSWKSYKISSGQGGEVYTEPPCRTNRQVRRPDVAYLTPELVAQFGDLPTLPQSFPLVAEIVSPTDIAEDVFLKAQEYLESSCQEVWLVFPESHLVFVVTQNQILGFRSGEAVSTQSILLGFSIEVDRLLA